MRPLSPDAMDLVGRVDDHEEESECADELVGAVRFERAHDIPDRLFRVFRWRLPVGFREPAHQFDQFEEIAAFLFDQHLAQQRPKLPDVPPQQQFLVRHRVVHRVVLLSGEEEPQITRISQIRFLLRISNVFALA